MDIYPKSSRKWFQGEALIPKDLVAVANNNSPTSKTLAVIGSGPRVVAGNLVYKVTISIVWPWADRLTDTRKLGGLDLATLGELQENGIHDYDEAAQHLRKTNRELYFFTP